MTALRKKEKPLPNVNAERANVGKTQTELLLRPKPNANCVICFQSGKTRSTQLRIHKLLSAGRDRGAADFKLNTSALGIT